ncbi:hypothetical protein BJV78DRAFT_1202900 [Lactifluus subvellereus]|nr:hypothetical protein BJV78DRAFT_1202900 [Lactifluus subvellereus]
MSQEFVNRPGGASDDTFVFIRQRRFGSSSHQTLRPMALSAGLTASEYERCMSRPNQKVPNSFFYRFTQDVFAFANKWADGRVVCVLEGGYSDNALLSGAMAHVAGLVDGRSAAANDNSRETWWTSENVQMMRFSIRAVLNRL